MPDISLKSKKMPASPIRKLVPYAEKAKQDGKIVYHLNIGQPDISTPDIVLKKMKNLDLDINWIIKDHPSDYGHTRVNTNTFKEFQNIIGEQDNIKFFPNESTRRYPNDTPV